jgi:hypothetical protein
MPGLRMRGCAKRREQTTLDANIRIRNIDLSSRDSVVVRIQLSEDVEDVSKIPARRLGLISAQIGSLELTSGGDLAATSCATLNNRLGASLVGRFLRFLSAFLYFFLLNTLRFSLCNPTVQLISKVPGTETGRPLPLFAPLLSL